MIPERIRAYLAESGELENSMKLRHGSVERADISDPVGNVGLVSVKYGNTFESEERVSAGKLCLMRAGRKKCFR